MTTNKIYTFIIVGVGGTGSLLARDLPKLLVNTHHKMVLIDGDIVEEKNIKRQSYQKRDVGENKAIALSSKINAFYDTKCEVIPRYLCRTEILEYIKANEDFTPVIVGCVDNNKTREIMENTYKQLKKENKDCVYIDSANGEYEGNIYISYNLDGKNEGVIRSDVYKLTEDLHPLEESCEVQASKGNVQYLVTNNKMSNYLLEHLNALLNGELKGGMQDVKRFNSVFY